MTTTSIDAPVGAQTTSRGNGRRPQPGSGHHILAYLFLGVLVVYFFIPIWWLFVASTKDAAGLFNGSSGALWFDETFALLPNLRDLFTYNEGIYVRWVANSLFYAIAGGAGATVLCVLRKVPIPGTSADARGTAGLCHGTADCAGHPHVHPVLQPPFDRHGVGGHPAVAAEPVRGLPHAGLYGRGSARRAARGGPGGRSGGNQDLFPGRAPAASPSSHYRLAAFDRRSLEQLLPTLAMLANTKLFPITVGLGLWEGQASGNNSGGANLWGIIIIGALVSVIPLIIAFLALQKYWKGGLSLGALK
jgi:multiple sugar transport system permease protein